MVLSIVSCEGAWLFLSVLVLLALMALLCHILETHFCAYFVS